jgi:hypothetical protein
MPTILICLAPAHHRDPTLHFDLRRPGYWHRLTECETGICTVEQLLMFDHTLLTAVHAVWNIRLRWPIVLVV